MKIRDLAGNTCCFVCECVFEKKRKPLVVKYDNDGDVQMLCGQDNHILPDPKLISLDEVRKFMPAFIDDINNLVPGEYLRIDNYGRCVLNKFAC